MLLVLNGFTKLTCIELHQSILQTYPSAPNHMYVVYETWLDWPPSDRFPPGDPLAFSRLMQFSLIFFSVIEFK